MIGREHDKAIFRWGDFADEDLLCEVLEEEVGKAGGLPADTAKARQTIAELLDRHGRDNLIELLMALAHSYHRTDAQSEPGWVLDSLDLKELTGKSYMANELDGSGPTEEARLRKLTVLVQFAFLGSGRRAGTVDFTHPILADYLAGRYALILLRRHASAFARLPQPRSSDYVNPKAAIQQAVGTAPLETGSIFFQYIAQEAAKDGGLKAFLKAMEMFLSTGPTPPPSCVKFQLFLKNDRDRAEGKHMTAGISIYNPQALGAPMGQYSHVTRVKASEFLFIAGMLSGDAAGNIIGEGDFNAQAQQVFRNIEAALQSAGAAWSNAVQFTTYLVHSQDIPNFMAFRLREFPKMFPSGNYPPNTLLMVDRLVKEPFLIEVQTIAAL
jgi:enamine deaminase RidA (YjgF/YER057c/UK114 family)